MTTYTGSASIENDVNPPSNGSPFGDAVFLSPGTWSWECTYVEASPPHPTYASRMALADPTGGHYPSFSFTTLGIDPTHAPGGDTESKSGTFTVEADGRISAVTGDVQFSLAFGNGPVDFGIGYRMIASCAGPHGAGNHKATAMSWTITDGAVAPDPEPDPGDVVDVVDDDDVFLDTLVNISDKVFRIERMGYGSGSFRIRRDAPDADLVGTGQDGRMCVVTIPRISSDPIFRWMIENIETVVVHENEQGEELISVAGRGALAYIGRAVASPFTYVFPAGPVEIHRGPAATGQKAGQILRRAIAEYQHVDRPQHPIPLVTIDFDYDVDSDGNTWATTDATDEMAVGYTGENALVGIQELWGTGGIDMVMQPNMLLQAFNHYGRDLTGSDFGAGVVRFVKGVNIADRLTRTRGTQLPMTHVWVEGDNLTFLDPPAELPGGGSRPVVEGFLKTIGTDPDFLEAVGISALVEALRRGESVAFNVDIPYSNDLLDEDTGQYLPGPEGTNGHFWIGDTVTVSTGTGVDDFEDEDARIEAITIWFDEANNLRCKVELKATTILGRIGPTTGSAGSFGGVGPGSVGGSGGTTPPPSPVSSDLHDHIVDTVDAHDASAISILDSGTNYASTNVEGALAEVMDEVQAHEADTTDAHDASAVSFSPTGSIAATDVQTAIAEVASEAATALADYVAKADDRAIAIECDGGGSPVSTGVKAYFQMPAAGHFRGAKIIAKDASSSAVFDVWKRAGNVPTVAQTITNTNKPTLTTAQLADPACTVSSWDGSAAFSANDWVGINLDSVTTATFLVLVLYYDWT